MPVAPRAPAPPSLPPHPSSPAFRVLRPACPDGGAADDQLIPLPHRGRELARGGRTAHQRVVKVRLQPRHYAAGVEMPAYLATQRVIALAVLLTAIVACGPQATPSTSTGD